MSNITSFRFKLFTAISTLMLVVAYVVYSGNTQLDITEADITTGSDGLEKAPVTANVKTGTQDTPPKTPALSYESRYGDLPESLEGTTLMQDLAVDEAGHLRVSNDLRMIFDYFLSAVTEEPVETIIARIDEYLEHHLESPALNEAREILQAYIALKESLYDYEIEHTGAVRNLIENGIASGSPDAYLSLLEEQLSARNALRAEHLPAEVHEAFYAREEAYDRYTLERMRVNANDGLSEADKALMLAQIDASAPEDLVAERKEAQKLETLQSQTQLLRESGAQEEDIHSLRAEAYGEEAAERFAKLDQERALWDQRLNTYLEQKQAILETPGLSEQDKTNQIERLRSSQFDKREQIRVKVLENRA